MIVFIHKLVIMFKKYIRCYTTIMHIEKQIPLFLIFIIILFLNILYNFSCNYPHNKLKWYIKHQSYKTNMFYHNNIGSAFYDKVRLGV